MERPLGNMEHALVLTDRFSPIPIVIVLRLHHAPPPTHVQKALDTLQCHHPLLRSTIVQHDKQLRFVVHAQPPRIELQIKPSQAWQSVVNAELNRRLAESTGPLLRATYLVPPADETNTPADLILTAHHAIMDAMSGIHFCRQLLALCTEGDIAPTVLPNATTGQTLVPATEAHFPASFTGLGRLGHTASFLGRQLADEFRYRRATPTPLAPIEPGGQCRVLTASLPAGTTADLVHRAREKRLSLNNVLLAAILLAVYRQLHAGQHLKMRLINFADLRPYLSPSPPADTLGCYIAMLRQTLPLAPGTDLWPLAAAVQERFYRANRRGDKYMYAVTAKQMMQMTIRFQPDRMAHAALSYAGPLEIEPAFGDTRLADIHAFIANNYLGPEYSAFARILFGELAWDIVYLDSDLDEAMAQTIADEMIGLLE